MTGASTRLTAAVEAYFADLGRIHASGGATGERSSYAPLANLLNAVGATLKPKVFCVGELADQSAGHPDFGLYAARQVQRGRPREGQTPERGVVEVKAASDDAWLTAAGDQVSRYWDRYRLVLVTNTRDFVLVGEDAAGRAAKLETFRLADSAEDFRRKLEKPRAFAREVGAGLGEYLCRALSHRAALAEPKDVAWLLASYARDGLARVEAAGDAPSLAAVRKALEEALGVRFEGVKGARFFRSTLVQTLFYGVFSAWVLWARAGAEGNAGGGGSLRSGGGPPGFDGGLPHSGDGLSRFSGGSSPEGGDGKLDAPGGPRKSGSHPAPLSAGGYGAGTMRFDWRTAVWHLRVPVLRALFQQLSDPGRLQPLGLVEVLDWTAAALDRVDREAFFARFHGGGGAEQDPAAGQSPAVPYFYEPFLEAFDPALRKQLGVWYTPAEVIRYMVARVDRALKDDLGIADGLAAEHVYVLDPCCGTGAYLAEVLRRIAANLEGRGLGALTGARVKQAATGRVFGFELMPAPFVVAHLQVGLTMQDLDAPLSDDAEERAGIFLTNALTGWEPRTTKPLPFPELEEERDRAERVKQDTPILVILGNPPYNGFAGMAVDEERALSEAYRTTRRVRRPEGQGLNDLYVRFFRMAERRIAEKTGQGIVCFISNYSWLDGLSFTGMRERYLEAFDAIRIDCLNGDKYKTGKVAPDGSPDPSIFSTGGDPVGIQVGTAIATLVRKARHAPAEAIGFRHLWGQAKREALLETAEAAPDTLYARVPPLLPLGLPFVRTAVSEDWFGWPSLPDLFPVSFPGVKTSRDGFLVDIDLDRLKARIADYFDPALGHEEIARRYPAAMKTTARFDARAVREALLARGGPNEDGFVRFAYRPFDNRWLYWEGDTKLLDEKRTDYRPHVFEGNLWLVTQQKPRREWSSPQAISHIGCIDLMDRSAACIPTWQRDDGIEGDDARRSGVLSPTHAARRIENDDDGAPRNLGPLLPDRTARGIGSDGDGPENPGTRPPAHAAGHIGSDGDGAPRNLGSSLPDRTARGIGSDGDGPRNPEARPPAPATRRIESDDDGAPRSLGPLLPDHTARGIGSDAGGPRTRNPGARPPAPATRRIGSDDDGPRRRRPNLSGAALRYLECLGLSVEDLFHHVLAVLHDPAYREANAGALRMEWPRIPLPGWPAPGNGVPGNGASTDADVPSAADRRSGAAGPPLGKAGVPPTFVIPAKAGIQVLGDTDAPPADEPNPNARESRTTPSGQVGRREAAHALAQSAARGRELARLLDSDTPVPGVTSGRLRPEIAAIAVPATTDGRNMSGGDFALSAGWGHYGTGGAVMPGQGRIVERPFTPEERAALGDTLPTLGETTFDVHLNARAFWRNVPATVWGYKLGGYQILKKWLSYRERAILDRPLTPAEVQHFTDVARRIAAIA